MTGNPRSVPQPERERTRRRTGRTASTDVELLARYRDVLRAELTATLDELAPAADPGLFGPNVKRRPLAERVALVGLAERVARALSGLAELDELDEPPAPPVKRHGRRGLGAIGD